MSSLTATWNGIVSALAVTSLLAAYASACGFGGLEATFTYEKGATGPENWGSLSPQFRSCSEGEHQSPIDIVKKDVVWSSALKPLETDYIPTNASLVDNAFNIAVQFNPNVGTVLVNGKQYHLRQMHWHSPAEHTIDGVRHPVELHLVHFSDDGNITVVAVLYKFGNADKFISQIENRLVELAKDVCLRGNATNIPLGFIDTKDLKRKTRKYYRYVGSLTAPPCTENVIWSILGKVREMTEEQATAIMAPLAVEYKHNSRPIQPLHGRTVELYEHKRPLLGF